MTNLRTGTGGEPGQIIVPDRSSTRGWRWAYPEDVDPTNTDVVGDADPWWLVLAIYAVLVGTALGSVALVWWLCS